MAKFRSHLSRNRTAQVSAGAGSGEPWRVLALFLLLLGSAAPGLSDPGPSGPGLSDPGLSGSGLSGSGPSDPGQPSEAATGCWTPGTAPDLFAWSDSPGIACRDSTETSGSADRAHAAQSAQQPTQAAGSTQSDVEITFSGNAYAGIAASF